MDKVEPVEPVDTNDLYNKIEEIRKHNDEVSRTIERKNELEERIDRCTTQIEEYETKIQILKGERKTSIELYNKISTVFRSDTKG